MHWANQQGLQGLDYRVVRDVAATAGTLAHDMIERDIKQCEMPDVSAFDSKIVTLAQTGYAAYRLWVQSTAVVIVATEVALVSETHKYGGCIDAIGQRDGRKILFDWKTSNGIYTEYIVQLAAYRQLWDENTPHDPIAEVHLLRFGKEWSDFHHHSWPLSVIDLAFEQFLDFRRCYDREKELKKLTK